ncbi:MAG: PorT family protein [Sphingobacteriales bacterium]|nr:MAG: PorT family protein [Sphingobacteriales bacterium]
MERINIWYSNHILGKKKIVSVLLLAFVLLLPQKPATAQGINKPFYDYSRRIHFGFTIGSSFSRIKYDFSPKWYTQDTFAYVNSLGYPGITLGAVANLHIGSTRSYLREHFDIRLIPSLVLAERRIRYTYYDTFAEEKKVESALVEAPLLMKFKSERFRNLRFYVIGGAKYSFDLSSDYKAAPNPSDPKLILKPHNFSYEYGTGLDIYFPFFKFSPEVRVSKGLNNILKTDGTDYSTIFSRFRSNFVYFSLYFEG